MRILAIGAHPDDVELGCGGFLQKATEKHIVILTHGEYGGHLNRVAESRLSAEYLSATCSIYDMQDTKVQIGDAIPVLEQEIQRYNPDIILTMTDQDTHQDHKATYVATKAAIRDMQCTALSYMSPSSARHFDPTYFVALNDREMKNKLHSLAFHNSQAYHKYLATEYITGIGRYWAMITKSNFSYVEPYKVIQYWR